ncbi:MAG: DEAD/DEAH box helicase [Chloroflexi bacterium]|nr:DEAD/DEAH box helicase [Chloroflexota bacterium]
MVKAVVSPFEALGLSPALLRALDAMGYERPTEIQERVIPLLLADRDVIGQAQTGTGKTAAFGIPIVERSDPERAEVQALVLAPTRELAVQITQELRALAQFRPLAIATIYGGSSMRAQLDALARGAQVVVGTPGRILDHLGRGTLDLSRVRLLVLDEADRMLDMGFMPDVERILRRLPRDRQTALFSATVPLIIKRLALRYMRAPEHVAVRPEEPTVETVEQVYYEVAERDKLDGLCYVLDTEQPQQAIIFCHMQVTVDRVHRALVRRGYQAEALHGNLRQSQRERILHDFRTGKLPLLVATNVAARGLDIPAVSHVINYDIPEDAETYVHRIGRTARAGRPGKAITFVAEWDGEAWAAIRKLAGEAIREQRLPLYG